MPRVRPALCVVALLGIAASGCATTPGLARPSPFPGGRMATTAAPAADTSITGGVLKRALALRGTPYSLGGDRPEIGLDCSGLVRYVFRTAEVHLPRTVAQQYRVGHAVDAADIQPGDLLFFDTTAPGPSHVGIALDAFTFVHAPGSGGFVRVDRLATSYWSTRLRGVRRVALAGERASGAVTTEWQ